MKYTILEFKDGLQLVPSIWLVNGEGKCFFPPFLSQLRIDKAIEEQEKPEKDWKTHNVQRIFGTAATYKQGIKKLSLAMRFLEIDNESDSVDEIKLSRMSVHKRRLDELEDNCPSPKKVISPLQVMRHLPQEKNIQLLFSPPTFTQPFYTSNLQHSNVHGEIDLNSSYHSSSAIQRERNNNEISDNVHKFLENFQNEISQKLDKINEKLQAVDKLDKKLEMIYKLDEKFQNVDKINERLETLDKINEKLPNVHDLNEKLQARDAIDENFQAVNKMNEKLQVVDKMNEKLESVIEMVRKYSGYYRPRNSLELAGKDLEESDVKRMVSEFFSDVEEDMFPFDSVQEFEEFEKNLRDPSYFIQMVNIFKDVEGKDLYSFVTGIMKKIMTNGVAEQYSWLGRKGKRVFKPFVLNKVILEAVRVRKMSAPDANVYDIISKWLVRAKSREDKKDGRTRKISAPGKLCIINK